MVKNYFNKLIEKPQRHTLLVKYVIVCLLLMILISCLRRKDLEVGSPPIFQTSQQAKVFNANGKHIGYVEKLEGDLISIRTTQEYHSYLYDLKVNAKRDGFQYSIPLIIGDKPGSSPMIITSASQGSYHPMWLWSKYYIDSPLFIDMIESGEKYMACFTSFEDKIPNYTHKNIILFFDNNAGLRTVIDAVDIPGSGGKDTMLKLGYKHFYRTEKNCSYKSIGSSQADQMDFPLTIQKHGKMFNFPA